MIIIMRPGASEEAVKKVTNLIKSKGLQVHLPKGDKVTIAGVMDDKTRPAGSNIEISESVDEVMAVTESYKLVNKKFHPEDFVILMSNTHIGPGNLAIMASPCAIENEEQLMETAPAVKRAEAIFLWGGACKSKTSPYSSQGLEEEGLRYMKETREATGLNVIYEVASQRAIETAAKYVDMLQIGARNIQNFELLKETGRFGIPTLLRRGLAATTDEWLNATEYITSGGNPNIALCERGTRTFEAATGNTLDINAVSVLKTKSHFPVIVDPSHTTGVRIYVELLAKCAVAVEVDSPMIEVRPCPEHTLSDGPQPLTFEQFDALTKKLVSFAKLARKSFEE